MINAQSRNLVRRQSACGRRDFTGVALPLSGPDKPIDARAIAWRQKDCRGESGANETGRGRKRGRGPPKRREKGDTEGGGGKIGRQHARDRR